MSRGNDQHGTFGFFSVQDWLNSVILSFPCPWKLAQRKGKYYGTIILDGRDIPIIGVWTATGEPSKREKEYWGDWTPEGWAEYCCDSHWECANDLQTANEIVRLRNQMGEDQRFIPERSIQSLADLVIGQMWEKEVFRDLVCGGPLRRRTKPGPSRTANEADGGEPSTPEARPAKEQA